MAANMDVDAATFSYPIPQQPEIQPTEMANIPSTLPIADPLQQRDNFKEIPVKVHIRRPEKDSWVYVGRGVVTLEVSGHSSQVVVRSTSTNKVLTMFGEASAMFGDVRLRLTASEQGSDLQAEKRGNFVVVGCVEGSKVISWSLNALNNAETLRLLASIELACYRCKQAVGDPRSHFKSRRKIERAIKDDRRKRHRRRKEQDSMIEAFAKQHLTEAPEPSPQP